jgi:hypothetical protein
LIVQYAGLLTLPPKMLREERESQFFACHGNEGCRVFPAFRRGDIEEIQESPW